MAFIIKTLVDITNTNAKRENKFEYQQQQNYLTLLQTISLRSNPNIIEIPTVDKVSTQKDFGVKGNNNVWTMVFDFEAANSHSVEMLTGDLDLVPVIANLHETIKLEPSAFFTTNGKINTVFSEVSIASLDK